MLPAAKLAGTAPRFASAVTTTAPPLILVAACEFAADKVSVTGTFNAAAVRGLGGGNPAERTARAAEETAKNTKRILQEAQHGGLVFS